MPCTREEVGVRVQAEREVPPQAGGTAALAYGTLLHAPDPARQVRELCAPHEHKHAARPRLSGRFGRGTAREIRCTASTAALGAEILKSGRSHARPRVWMHASYAAATAHREQQEAHVLLIRQREEGANLLRDRIKALRYTDVSAQRLMRVNLRGIFCLSSTLTDRDLPSSSPAVSLLSAQPQLLSSSSCACVWCLPASTVARVCP